jgi:hypothetical protein
MTANQADTAAIDQALDCLDAAIASLAQAPDWKVWLRRAREGAREMAPQVARSTEDRRLEALAILERVLTGRGWVIQRSEMGRDAPGVTMKSRGEGAFAGVETQTIMLGIHLEGDALIGVLAHEMIHSLWEDGDLPSNPREAECEAAAYVVGRIFGFGDLAYSSAYVLQWGQADASDLVRESPTVRAAAEIAVGLLTAAGLERSNRAPGRR